MLRMSGDLVDVLVAILPEQDVITVLHRGKRGRHQERHEAVLGELQLVDDVRAEQRQCIGERREPEARMQLFGDGGSAHEVAAFDDQGLEPLLGQIGAVGEPVVAATDHDCVVFALGGSRHGDPLGQAVLIKRSCGEG